MEDLSHYKQNPDAFFHDAFIRNIGLLTEEEQKILRESRVAIVGCGGVGGYHLLTLLRLGVGNFTIADMDTYSLVNIQRQAGAYMDTIGRNKAEVMQKMALSINPHVQIRHFPEGVTVNNVTSFFDGADVFIDGIDFFSIEERRLLFRTALQNGIYAVTAGPLGFSGALLVFSPEGMSFDEYFDLHDKQSYEEKLIAFGVGLAPASLHMHYIDLDSVDLRSKKGPSLVSACMLCGVLAATETINILLKRRRPKAVPHYLQFDPFLRQCKSGYLRKGNRHIIQLIKRWYLRKRLLSKKQKP